GGPQQHERSPPSAEWDCHSPLGRSRRDCRTREKQDPPAAAGGLRRSGRENQGVDGSEGSLISSGGTHSSGHDRIESSGNRRARGKGVPGAVLEPPRTTLTAVRVRLGPRSYSIHIGPGLLAGSAAKIVTACSPSSIALLTHPRLAALYGQHLVQGFADLGVKVVQIVIPP